MRERYRDYALLIAVSALLTLPNLGATSLWDVDEGVNAEAAREMRETNSWVIPTFNYELRTAKPVMLYWIQRASYALFGVSEWSARLPSVLAVWLTVLLVYELARRMFDRATGLLAGIVLVSAIEVCVLAHAATPDAVLLLFTVLTYYLFWTRHQNNSRKWWVACAAACGLAVLTKGPVGVALPGLVFLLYFAWNRELSRLLDRKIFTALFVFLLVAGPWYGLVTAETRGRWAKAFFERENLQRFSTPMENHRGPFFYHAAGLFVLFAPWSVFLVGAVWYGIRGSKREPAAELTPHVRAYRFLVCWFAAYLVFFSLAATKLPNYVLPLYPAITILTARFLTRWRAAELALPKWMMPTAVAGLFITAVVVGAGVLIASGRIAVLPANARLFPALAPWAALGLVPLIAGVFMFLALRQNNRERFVKTMAVGAVVFAALLAAFPSLKMDEYKAPKSLVRDSGIDNPTRDIRVARFEWFQPSVVFYARREVVELKSIQAATEFFAVPTPGYLFVPARTWEQHLEAKVAVPTRIVARHHDFLKNYEVVVVTNDTTTVAER